jgi:hypothetical protein
MITRYDASRQLHRKARNRTRRKCNRKIRDVRSGSDSDLSAPKSNFRCTPETGHRRQPGHVGFVPDSDMVTLLDHLVGGRKERRWYGETKGLGGLASENDHAVPTAALLERD